MILPDALLNAKKYIREPKYSAKDRMWYYEKQTKDRWTAYYFITEEACWEAFYEQFRAIKEKLMQGNERGGK